MGQENFALGRQFHDPNLLSSAPVKSERMRARLTQSIMSDGLTDDGLTD